MIDEPELDRYGLHLGQDGWVRPTGRPTPARLPVEFALREVLEVDVADPSAVVGFFAEHGAPPWEGSPRRGAPAPPSWHPDDMVHEVVTLQALVHHWLAHMNDEYVAEAWDDAPEGRPNSEGEAWVEWVSHLNRRLEPFSVRAEVSVPGFATGAPAHIDLGSAVAVQLYNLAVENLTPRRCGNETCRRWFIRQRGGARAGQYRLAGVEFCTPLCARTQGQRRRRREQRRTRGEH